MICFNNDYSEGAHPAILQALTEENLRQNPGYGMDSHCAAAAAKIRELAQCPQADVHFLVGGTPCNLISLTAFLRPHQAAIAADTGHIAVHESGSIEAAGHKVCTIAAPQGKLTGALVRKVAAEHTDEHMVQPKLVFVSDSTELGTIYTKAELTELRKTCDELELYLYLDGARLASALTCSENDLTLADLAALTDAFYLGGTKNGMLIGEALVITNNALKADFRYIMKQRGGMLAKLKEGLAAAGCQFVADSPTNQIFPILPRAAAETLSKDFGFERWGAGDAAFQPIRLVCSWATKQEDVDAFLAAFRAAMAG